MPSKKSPAILAALVLLLAAGAAAACGGSALDLIETPTPSATAEPSNPANVTGESTPEVEDEEDGEGATEYTVQPGDTLSVIAQTFGVTVDVIVEANGLGDANLIRPGDTLQIPEAE